MAPVCFPLCLATSVRLRDAYFPFRPSNLEAEATGPRHEIVASAVSTPAAVLQDTWILDSRVMITSERVLDKSSVLPDDGTSGVNGSSKGVRG
jgi:hypothetical protein